jgi:dTDP-4-dehydrorhamnose reductase
MTRWLVTGSSGMLGQDVMAALRARGEIVLGTRRRDLDITNATAVRALIGDYRPGIVVNCAAWTAVDAAETQAESALAVNGLGAENLARACADTGALMAHISTDYVFDGNAGQPYAEDAEAAPRTEYGRSKLAGELAVLGLLPRTGLVIRTAWLYGGSGPSFVHTMVRLATAQPAVDVVDDQRGQPTWTADVAGQVIALTTARAAGIYHATSSGETTWFGLAREIFSLLGADPERVRPATSEAFPRPAPRPAYSVLAHDRHRDSGFQPIGRWQLALRRAWPTLSVASPTGQGSLAAKDR